MKRIVSWLIGLPVAVVVVGLAVANRHSVRFSLDPFSADAPLLAFDVPLYALLLAAAFAGMLAGGIASWLSQGRWRKAARSARAENARLRFERDRARREAERRSGLLPASARQDPSATYKEMTVRE